MLANDNDGRHLWWTTASGQPLRSVYRPQYRPPLKSLKCARCFASFGFAKNFIGEISWIWTAMMDEKDNDDGRQWTTTMMCDGWCRALITKIMVTLVPGAMRMIQGVATGLEEPILNIIITIIIILIIIIIIIIIIIVPYQYALLSLSSSSLASLGEGKVCVKSSCLAGIWIGVKSRKACIQTM